MKHYIFASVCLLGLAACSSMKDFLSDADKSRIEARDNGAYAAVAVADNKEDASNYAASGAKGFCAKKGQTAVILGTKNNYEGLTGEKGDKMIKKAGELAMLAGAGGKAALAADEMTEDSKYEVEMSFRCE